MTTPPFLFWPRVSCSCVSSGLSLTPPSTLGSAAAVRNKKFFPARSTRANAVTKTFTSS